jgi:TPR repeat protein
LRCTGGFTINPVRAKEYYERAASQGYLNSCHNLACLLEGGTKGIKTDIKLAEKLYIITHQQHHLPLMILIPLSVDSFKFAAHRGHAESSLALFRLYYEYDDDQKSQPTGIAKDVERGLTYLYIAARAGGSPLAMRLLGQMHAVVKSPIYDTAAAEQWLTQVCMLTITISLPNGLY